MAGIVLNKSLKIAGDFQYHLDLDLKKLAQVKFTQVSKTQPFMKIMTKFMPNESERSPLGSGDT
jgi:hypothetical protein